MKNILRQVAYSIPIIRGEYHIFMKWIDEAIDLALTESFINKAIWKISKMKKSNLVSINRDSLRLSASRYFYINKQIIHVKVKLMINDMILVIWL